MEHLFGVSYPARWLVNILSAICTSHITTDARTRRDTNVREYDLDETFTKREMCVVPWRAEFATFHSIWRRVLSFGFIVTRVALVQLQDIRQYTISFPMFWSEHLRVPHFMLVFWDIKYGSQGPPRNSRRLLLDEEEDEQFADTTRESGVYAVTTFKFVTLTRKALFERGGMWSRIC